MTVRRYVVIAALGLGLSASYNSVAAQIGHDPAISPYRDIPLHSGPVVFIGHLSADRGRAGVGPSNAFTLGARYEIPTGRSLVIQFTSAYLQADRFIVDPSVDSTAATRRIGPVKTDLALAEIGLQLRLTGGKTWRGLAPYVGTGLGLMFDVNSPGDTTRSGYRFGTKISIAAATGVRWYASRHLTVTGDVRAHLWKLKYPLSFHEPAPDGSLIVPSTEPLSDWTLHPWISLGIGWTF